METPEEIRSEQAADFAADQLQGRPRILCVGRPASRVPTHLAAVGFGVTSAAATDLAGLTEPFDAIVFSHALSSVASLEAAVEQAARLLAPTGRLVVDDIDVQAVDTMSVRWFYDVVELLVVAGHYAASRVHKAHLDPVARWREGIRGEGVRHTGTDMRVAISTRFAIRDLKRVEGFYRQMSDGLPADSRGAAIAAHLRSVERRLLASDAMLPVGLRIVADRAR
jgi:hypothetical protein